MPDWESETRFEHPLLHIRSRAAEEILLNHYQQANRDQNQRQ
jgi:hypothetical protein